MNPLVFPVLPEARAFLKELGNGGISTSRRPLQGLVSISPNLVRETCLIGRWQDPAVEEQPTDPAYRIGGLKKVAVPVITRTATRGERTGRMVGEKRNPARSSMKPVKTG